MMFGSMLPLWERLSRGWCRAFHPLPMWPVNGYYRCPECFRTYPVPWANRCYAPRPVRRPEEVPALPARPRVVSIARPAGKPA